MDGFFHSSPRLVSAVELRYHEACTAGFQSPPPPSPTIHVNSVSIVSLARVLELNCMIKSPVARPSASVTSRHAKH